MAKINVIEKIAADILVYNTKLECKSEVDRLFTVHNVREYTITILIQMSSDIDFCESCISHMM